MFLECFICAFFYTSVLPPLLAKKNREITHPHNAIDEGLKGEKVGMTKILFQFPLTFSHVSLDTAFFMMTAPSR